jgi:hypothetical protein
MTGDATTAMAAAARIALRLALIIDLANRIALAPLRSSHPALHKSDVGHEIVLENLLFTPI